MNARAAVSKYSNALFPTDQETSEQLEDNSKSTKLGFFEEHEAFAEKRDEVIDSDTDSDLVPEEAGEENDDEESKGKNQQQLINQEEEDDPVFEKQFEPLIEKQIEPLIEKKLEPLFEKKMEPVNESKFDFMSEDDTIEKTTEQPIKSFEKIVDNTTNNRPPTIQKITAEPKVTNEFVSTRTEYKPVITSNRKPSASKKVTFTKNIYSIIDFN